MTHFAINWHLHILVLVAPYGTLTLAGAGYPPVEVGDVGFVRQGQFHRLFNALLSADDPSHEIYGVPENYQSLQPHVRNHITSRILRPNTFCSSGIRIVSGGLQVLAAE